MTVFGRLRRLHEGSRTRTRKMMGYRQQAAPIAVVGLAAPRYHAPWSRPSGMRSEAGSAPYDNLRQPLGVPPFISSTHNERLGPIICVCQLRASPASLAETCPQYLC